jgi:hypothetical protein
MPWRIDKGIFEMLASQREKHSGRWKSMALPWPRSPYNRVFGSSASCVCRACWRLARLLEASFSILFLINTTANPHNQKKKEEEEEE